MTDEDPVKYGGSFSTVNELHQPVRVNKFISDLFSPMRLNGDPVEYKIWTEEDERKRRAAMTWRQRWKEDHPNFWRKFFPWTIHKWDEPCYRSDDDEWD